MKRVCQLLILFLVGTCSAQEVNSAFTLKPAETQIVESKDIHQKKIELSGDGVREKKRREFSISSYEQLYALLKGAYLSKEVAEGLERFITSTSLIDIQKNELVALIDTRINSLKALRGEWENKMGKVSSFAFSPTFFTLGLYLLSSTFSMTGSAAIATSITGAVALAFSFIKFESYGIKPRENINNYPRAIFGATLYSIHTKAQHAIERLQKLRDLLAPPPPLIVEPAATTLANPATRS